LNPLTSFVSSPSASFVAEGDFIAINDLYRQRGWTDGLPIIPPNLQRVEEMLAFCDRPWNDPIGLLAPRWAEATPWRLAANAVMAGCRPEYFPIILLAVEAMMVESFNLYGIQATTHLCAPLLVVNGPIAKELAINCGSNAFGPGYQSNASIGRAIRLILLNIGGAIPGTGDMATLGSPAKYSYCIAENESQSPWSPFHVERGFSAEVSTVTVIGAEAPHNVNDHESHTAQGILKMIAGTCSTPGTNDIAYSGEPLIILSPEHAATVAQGGFSKQAVKEYLFKNAWVRLDSFSEENIERRMRIKFPLTLGQAPMDARVPVVQKPEDFLIMVVGGAGKHSAFIPTFGATRSVTLPLKNNTGLLVHSIQDFKGS
jgi:hypothetical protein